MIHHEQWRSITVAASYSSSPQLEGPKRAVAQRLMGTISADDKYWLIIADGISKIIADG